MSAFAAALELLPIIGEAPELLKLGGSGAIIDELVTQINNIMASGLSLAAATNQIRNRYLSNVDLNNVVNPRGRDSESKNEDFINRINQSRAQSTLRQRRPLTDEISPAPNRTIDQPIFDRMPRPIRRPRDVAGGIAAAGAVGATINQFTGYNPSTVRIPESNPNINTTPPDVPILNPPTTPATTISSNPVLNNIPIDISDNIRSPGSTNLEIEDYGIKGAYKYPQYHWNYETGEKYMHQALYNLFSNQSNLL